MSTPIRNLTRNLTDEAMAKKIVELRDDPPKGVAPDFASELANRLEWELGQRCDAHLEMFGLG